jgi:hypothetical protein
MWIEIMLYDVVMDNWAGLKYKSLDINPAKHIGGSLIVDQLDPDVPTPLTLDLLGIFLSSVAGVYIWGLESDTSDGGTIE